VGRPSPLQVRKVALDVARGMDYLHTAFEKDGEVQPVIHRDLKSPNLLLAQPPGGSAEEVQVKITDFGLSRDKQHDKQRGAMQTAKMTGCGSVLWMAPEILLGKTYNEKVDVYGFAMCLVELIDCERSLSLLCMRHSILTEIYLCHTCSCYEIEDGNARAGHLPWHRHEGGSARVPDRVGRRERPERQLDHASLSPAMKALVYACWSHSPSDRPAFGEVVRRLESMQLPREARSRGAHAGETVLGGSE
jgi:serine/threonine protein kinase